MNDGKKSVFNDELKRLPEVVADSQHLCNGPDSGVKGELIPLETLTSPQVFKNGKRVYRLYWKCICKECRKEVKVFSTEYEAEDQSK